MKYKGKELVGMTPETWDGKTREMLVWCDYEDKPTLALVCGFTIKGHPIADTGNYKKENAFKRFNVFQYCAEIPKEEPNQVQNIDEMIKILNAYKEGKTIEHRFRNRDIGDSWGGIDMQNPEWNWGIFEYRVKPDLEEIVHKKFNAKIKSVKKARRMTNRELADLMATGKVEKCYPHYVDGRDVTKVYRTHSHYRNREDSPCAKSILIRYEGTNEWVKPLIKE